MLNSLDIKETFQWLEKTNTLGSKPGLKPIKSLLKELNNPNSYYKCVHVTGTNGKGSTSVMAQSILTAAGYRVGLFTSPHLHDFTESITINGKPIEKIQVAIIINKIKNSIDALEKEDIRHPTYFEILSTIAFEYFKEENIDIAVIEVGMGGRDDATNAIDSKVSVITNISLEHTEFLGKTEMEIVETKAGIIKEDTTLVTAVEQPEIFERLVEICRDKNCKIIHVGSDLKAERVSNSLKGQVFNIKFRSKEYKELFTPLLGRHQLKNAMCAIAAAITIEPLLSDQAIREGLCSVKWPGRLEVIKSNPLILLDGAKDLKATQALVDSIQTDFKHQKVTTVISISSDKNISGIIKTLSNITDQFILTKHRVSHRAADTEILVKHVERNKKMYKVFNHPTEALYSAINMSGNNDLILVTGSIFFIGQATEILHSMFSSNSG
jgi:dihydrofolate synthase/folylpolyglutamate synthase